MPKIKPLSSSLIAQIAAGEVIERPVSVVKELVENALDAGATTIKIDIEKSGFKSISVLDNGHGMTGEDLLECFKPHTTSKIETDDDLDGITSFGFRGEALSSIIAISQMEIRSKPADEPVGTSVMVAEREVLDVSPVGMPTGTQVIVRSLFDNTPARKKFLTNLATEYCYIVNHITRAALSFSAVGFSLTHNGRLILQLPKHQTQEQRIRSLLGADTAAYLIPLRQVTPHLTIEGFIGKPQLSVRSKSKQFLYVNKRHIRNLSLSLAAKEAFGSLLDPKSHPLLILSLTLPPEHVDVNIHPRKEEIKFLSNNEIISNVREAIRATLDRHDLTFAHMEKTLPFFYDTAKPADGSCLLNDGSSPQWERERHTATVLREQTPVWQVKEAPAENEIMQIHNTYLVLQTTAGLQLIDQHAAHERILYEQFLQAYQSQQANEQNYTLPVPETFELSLPETVYLQKNLSTFTQLGFEIETFGTTTFKLNAIPELFRGRNIPLLISELLDELMQEKGAFSIDRQTHRTIAYLACRSAIKAGDYLTQDERRRLVEKLQQTKSSYTCPHGRPVSVGISKSELERMFRRK